MDFEREFLRLLPQLRACARRLVLRAVDADDLGQDVAVRALAAQARFDLGTNLRAWLFTILRNRFCNAYTHRTERNLALEDASSGALATPIWPRR
jgi:RNA polymerase sigma-70 factor, ECF subfamily